MREYPESEKGKELFFWLSGFIAAGVADAGSVRYEETMDEISNLICDTESEVRQQERESCMVPNPNSKQGMVECCVLRPHHLPKVHFHPVNGGTIWRDEVIDKAPSVN